MKKKSFVVLLWALLLVPVFSMEWGGLITDQTKGSSQDFETFPIEQSNSVFLWVNTSITPDSSWFFNSEIMYKFNFGFFGTDEESGEKITSLKNIIDIDLFKISGTVPLTEGIFSLAAGRYFIVDNSGIVFDQVCDGALLKFSQPLYSVSGYFGYTGLLNALNVSMLEPLRDDTGMTATYSLSPEAKFYALAHPYLPMLLSVDFPAVFKNQTLSLQASAFIDVKKSTDEVEYEKSNRYYGSFELKGPMGGPVYYDFVTVAGSNDFKSLYNYSKFQLLVYPTNKISFKIGAEYASGKQGILTTFTGFTSNTAYNSLSSPEYGEVLLPQVSFSTSSKSFYVNVAAKAVLTLPETQLSFSGVEGNLSSLFNIFSDFQILADVTGFFDIGQASENTESYYAATVGAKISF